MELSPDFSVSLDTNRLGGTITDSTTYGGANPARADLLVFLSGFKLDASQDETALTVTGNDEDPATDTSWTFNITADGAFKFCWVAIPEYAGGTTYARYDAVYSGAVVYRSKSSGNVGQSVSDTTYWEVISDPADLANNKGSATESLNITSTIYLRTLTPNGQYYFANYLSDEADPDTLDDSLQKYNIWRWLLDAAAVADSRSEVEEGERICRIIESRYITE